MDIRVLRNFLVICREGNMSRAAKALHLTQPTLSRQISQLETELGCTLLVRGGRSVTLTEKGLYLRRRAEEIVEMADQTAFELSRDSKLVEGDVLIGAGESEGMRVVASRIRTFRQRYPHVRFRIRSGNSLNVVEWLETGVVDFAVLMSYPDITRFDHIRLSPTDTWGVIMPADDPLAEKETIAPGDLLGKPLVASEQSVVEGHLSEWFGDLLDAIDVAATYNLAFNAAILAKERVGYVLTFDKLVQVGEGTGLEFKLLDPPVTSVIDFAWKHDQVMSSAARRFLQEMTEERSTEDASGECGGSHDLLGTSSAQGNTD